jgi:hypothetical protein
MMNMKKIIYLTLITCILSTILISCDNDTDMLFDQTASERKLGAINEYKENLLSADQGWIFQYFPDDNQSYGGYNFVVKFSQADSVSIWTELANPSDSINSLYDVIAYGGPVLTFNTYNTFMHYFATPSSQRYNALGGDYEFLILSGGDDVMSVKGTKTGNLMQLIKLTESPSVYLSKVTAIADKLNQGSLSGQIDGKDLTVSRSGRVLTISDIGDSKGQTLTVPFILTDTGLQFYEPIEIGGHTYQHFTFDNEALRFNSTDGSMSLQIVVPPVNLTLAPWLLNIVGDNTCSDAVYNAFVEAYTANAQVWGEQLATTVVMGGVRVDYGDIGISFYSYPGPYRAHYNLNFAGVSNHPDYLDIVKVGAGFNWSFYTHLGVFPDMITDHAPYLVEMDNADSPTRVTLTSVADPDVWFVLTKN